VLDTDVAPILDFTLTLSSIPQWMSIYSSASNGYVQRITATLKVDDSQSHYEGFTRALRSIVSTMLRKSLKKVFPCLSMSFVFNVSNFCSQDEALSLWNERCEPP
jgi:hypothetical protein